MRAILSKITNWVSLRHLLLIMAILIGAAIIAEGAVILGTAIIMLLGLPFLFLTIYNYRYGIVILFLFGGALFQINRILGSELPFGILFDFLIILMFISIIVSSNKRKSQDFKLRDPITVFNLIFFTYFTIEVMNPNAVTVMAWLASIRTYIFLPLYFTFILYFEKKESIKKFIYLWFFVALVVALYGLQQEFLGLRDYEWRWIFASPERYDLYFNWGHMRVFSILSDPTAFGLFMAFTGLSTMILSFGPFSFIKKALLITMTVICFVSMAYSGTRTAYAMVMVGVVFFVILNIKNLKVLAGSLIIIFAFLVLMIGPFYSGPIVRIRSTFNISEDASMGVRDVKRIRFQNYIQSHPIGGGVNTAGHNGLEHSPGHPLSGNFDPDSGYLRAAMELGWVGLILIIALNLSIVVRGIGNNYSIRDPILKIYNMAFIVPFFGLTVAHYTQDAMFQKPILLPVLATYALMIKLKELDKSKEET